MVDLNVPLASKKKAYREDFVTKQRLATAHLQDWIRKQADTCQESAAKSLDMESAFGWTRKGRAFKEVLEHIQTMSNK